MNQKSFLTVSRGPLGAGPGAEAQRAATVRARFVPTSPGLLYLELTETDGSRSEKSSGLGQ